MENRLAPWKVLEARRVFESRPWIAVDEQRIELPDGRVVESYFRVHLRPWVVMAVLTPDLRLIVNRSYRHGPERVVFGLPGGLLDEGEGQAEAARRELLEETGYVAEGWLPLGSYVPNANYRCGEAHIWAAFGARQVADPDSGDLEASEVHLVPLDDMAAALAAGEADSMSTALAVMLLQAELRRRELRH
jgi:ADP-ribose pyrophosphatase